MRGLSQHTRAPGEKCSVKEAQPPPALSAHVVTGQTGFWGPSEPQPAPDPLVPPRPPPAKKARWQQRLFIQMVFIFLSGISSKRPER